MEILEWIRFILAAAFLLGGIVIFLVEIFGMYRFRFVLNRMQIAATGDTLGLGLCLIGLMVANGANPATAKMLLVLLFFWIASPVSSHVLSRMEYTTDEKITDHLRILTLEEAEREIKEQEDRDEHI
ncbi:MAG: monovalent cation/H(+) antiporter subunit G [Lachnospiraceae bacterium]|nr:monovalent cation/H(+) antiporter subunit G [Lachnospiraceae bacterium]